MSPMGLLQYHVAGRGNASRKDLLVGAPADVPRAVGPAVRATRRALGTRPPSGAVRGRLQWRTSVAGSGPPSGGAYDRGHCIQGGRAQSLATYGYDLSSVLPGGLGLRSCCPLLPRTVGVRLGRPPTHRPGRRSARSTISLRQCCSNYADEPSQRGPGWPTRMGTYRLGLRDYAASDAFPRGCVRCTSGQHAPPPQLA